MLGKGVETFDAVKLYMDKDTQYTTGTEGLLATILLVPLVAVVGTLIGAHLGVKQKEDTVKKLLPHLKPLESKIANAYKTYSTTLDNTAKAATNLTKAPYNCEINTRTKESLESFTKSIAQKIIGAVRQKAADLEYVSGIDGIEIHWSNDTTDIDAYDTERSKVRQAVKTLCKTCSTKQCELDCHTDDYGFSIDIKQLYLGISKQELDTLKKDTATIIKASK